MLLMLVATTDKIQLARSSAADLDVLAFFMDASTADPPVVKGSTSGKQLTAFNTAATGDIVAAPAASTLRTIKSLIIRNKHASLANDVTVIFDANGTDYELFKCTLNAGETLEFIEGIGFFIVTTAVPNIRTKRLAADQNNSTTTLTEVAGLSLQTGVGSFLFEYFLIVQSTLTTTGHRFSVNHDGTVTSFVAGVMWPGGTTAAADAVDQDFVAAGGQLMSGFFARAKSTLGWGTTLSVDTANADVLYQISGIMDVTVDGNIELWHGSEVAAQSTVKAGSGLRLTKMAA